MNDLILFPILGLGAGAVYALLSLGIVLIHKGTGTVNFAQGAIAGCSAIYFGIATSNGTPLLTAALTCIITAGIGGALFYAVVMRQLRQAPALARIVATLGLMLLLQGVATQVWKVPTVVARPIFPVDSIRILGMNFGIDRVYLTGTAIVLAVVLWAAYRYTRFGIVTRAASGNERGVALLGYSPDAIGAANWALGCMLAALAGVLFAPIAALNISTLTLLVVPALAAALVGRFDSFGITVAVALAIGAAQSLLTRFWTQPGINDALPFVLIVVVMVVTGQLIPGRGARETSRLPLAPAVRRRAAPLAAVAAITVLGLVLLGNTYRDGIVTSLIMVMLALSLVVVTGFTGQISLMQMAFAGLAAFAVSKLGQDLGLPFPVPIILSAVIVVPIGVAIGFASLRVRGISLAVVTLGAAVAVSSFLFGNASWTGGADGSHVPSPSLFGWSLDSVAHPVRFGIVTLVVTLALMAGVLNIRMSSLGRRMLAVRSNERAAAASGINVQMTKLQAFGLSTFVAGVGGGMLAYQLGAVAFTRFAPIASIMLLALAYIGGIATVYGALTAGVIANGGVLYVALTSVDAISEWWIIISGAMLIINAVVQPDGIALAVRQQVGWAVRRFRTPPPAAITSTPAATPAPTAVDA
ncbi:ABC transporter permease [Gordonia hydrophobica]|uniref:ABC transporter permease n=1 Tax=Gordonia hydrophobica TaxID=40516 RepID=A0ABZ2TWB7_9ACTN|nr:ABC transporter permease [Gordonia hydrophobica]MBM7365805.1 ABC-type branched-subunit amino acid transport system permease subunit [Gordonia hydrophobica]